MTHDVMERLTPEREEETPCREGSAATQAKALPSSGEVRVRCSTGGEKGSKPCQLNQFPPEVLWELGEHFGKGSEKYAPHNFRRGYDWSLSYNALMRHLLAFWAGEDIDPETGSKHVVAAAWHCICLSIFMDEHRDFDDRYKKETT